MWNPNTLSSLFIFSDIVSQVLRPDVIIKKIVLPLVCTLAVKFTIPARVGHFQHMGFSSVYLLIKKNSLHRPCFSKILEHPFYPWFWIKQDFQRLLSTLCNDIATNCTTHTTEYDVVVWNRHPELLIYLFFFITVQYSRIYIRYFILAAILVTC